MHGPSSTARRWRCRGPASLRTERWVAYGNDGKTEIVEIATADVTAVDALSEAPAWDGNDTLIVDDEYH